MPVTADTIGIAAKRSPCLKISVSTRNAVGLHEPHEVAAERS